MTRGKCHEQEPWQERATEFTLEIKIEVEIKKDDENTITNTMGDDGDKKDPPGTQAHTVVEINCPHKDPEASSKPCPLKHINLEVLKMHERAMHLKKDAIKTNQDKESKADPKKSKRMEAKITRFTESETPSEYRRKMIEFES